MKSKQIEGRDLRATEPAAFSVERQAAEFARRFKARIVSVLTVEDSPWTLAEAIDAAENEWAAFDEPKGEDALWALDNSNPEDDADECLSYWTDDGE